MNEINILPDKKLRKNEHVVLNYVVWTRHKGALLIDYASVLISHRRCDNSVYKTCFIFSSLLQSIMYSM